MKHMRLQKPKKTCVNSTKSRDKLYKESKKKIDRRNVPN